MRRFGFIALSAIVLLAIVSWLAGLDHRADRNVPGATTSAGKRSVAE
jgi:hypothetical protein